MAQGAVERGGRGPAHGGLLLDPLARRAHLHRSPEDGGLQWCLLVSCVHLLHQERGPTSMFRRSSVSQLGLQRGSHMTALAEAAMQWPMPGRTDQCALLHWDQQHCLTAHVQGGGFSWILGWQNGAPPLGWPQTLAYLALPAALVASQFVTQRIMQPPSQDPQQQQSAAFLKFLPFVIGALPSDCWGSAPAQHCLWPGPERCPAVMAARACLCCMLGLRS